MRGIRKDASVGEMRPEYDFTGGVRGKYTRRMTKGSLLVVLDPDVAKVFPDARSVNAVLRAIAKVIRRPAGARTRPTTR